MSLTQNAIGVDIAEGWIGVFHASSSRHEHIIMTRQALARFARVAKGCLVVLEASGGCERPLTGALAKAGVDDARVTPRQARECARATGTLARTDKVDATIPARMGRALDLAPTPPVDPDRAHLAELVARRKDLVTTIGRGNRRLGTASIAWIIKEIESLIKVLPDHLQAVAVQIAALIEARETLATETAACVR